MESREKWQCAVAEFAQQMRSLYGPTLDKIVLFGSRARNDASEDSDVDLLVVLKQMDSFSQEMRRIDPIASAVSLQYDVVLVPLALSSTSFERGEQPFVQAGQREGVLVE